jgi:hypothetical protein
MTVLPTCPACGLVSDDVRCPRCNALKVVGCSGSCTLCTASSGCASPLAPGERPSDGAREDREHPGTPLER